jgi:hypothetical protein
MLRRTPQQPRYDGDSRGFGPSNVGEYDATKSCQKPTSDQRAEIVVKDENGESVSALAREHSVSGKHSWCGEACVAPATLASLKQSHTGKLHGGLLSNSKVARLGPARIAGQLNRSVSQQSCEHPCEERYTCRALIGLKRVDSANRPIGSRAGDP